MAKELITICTSHGIILDARAMGTDKDVRVGPQELVDVPKTYGEHLIGDRFAVRAERPKKPSRAEMSAAEKARKATIAQAEDAVVAAQAKVDAAGDNDARTAAEAELEAAVAALAAIEA